MSQGGDGAAVVRVQHGNSQKQLLVYPGMPAAEIKCVLAAAFGLTEVVAGLRDPDQDVHFPLSLVSKAPAFFADRPSLGLSLANQSSLSLTTTPETSALNSVFRLDEQQVSALMESFKRAAPTGRLDRATFQRCFESVLGQPQQQESAMEMHALLSRLFDVFDRNNDHCVDTLEFMTGLSVLGRGQDDEKIRATFEAYDENGDGVISLGEMTRYLTSVFSVIAQTSPDVFEGYRITPEELALATAKRCFQEAGLGHDGRLTFDEFKTWYASPDSQPLRTLGDRGSVPSFDTLRRITGFGDRSSREVFSVFKRSAPDGLISRDVFARCCNVFSPDSSSSRHVIDRVFTIFDSNGDGVVDFAELLSGLSVLCGGTRDEKVRAAFDLVDVDKDGFISPSEMVQYLTAVFKLVYHTSPETERMSKVGPEELARITTQRCFVECDLNHDERLSFDEFKRWYSQNQDTSQVSTVADDLEPESFPESVDELCRLTNLRSYTTEDITNLLREFTDANILDLNTFSSVFRALRDGTGHTPEEETRAEEAVRMLFNCFDEDGNGLVDHAELTSGLSVLCGGSPDDRIAAAFSLYDENGDGYISEHEMRRYLKSVFRIMFKVNPGAAGRLGDVDPDTLAEATAEQAFREADANGDGRISYGEFREWYKSAEGHTAVAEISASASKIEELRRLTNLREYDISAVLEFFLNRADPDGTISRPVFYDCFQTLIRRQTGGQLPANLGELLNFLWVLFDSDGNGKVDMPELSAGISVLTGGSRDDKVRTAFALFDERNQGMDLGELTRYLSSVYKVLYETTPQTRETMGVPPESLARITAEQCFQDMGVSPHGGCIGYEQFQSWYSQPSDVGATTVTPTATHQAAAASTITAAPPPPPPPPPHAASTARASVPQFSLGELQELSGLGAYPPETVFRVFAECADDQGMLSRASSLGCFRALVLSSLGAPLADSRTKAAVEGLFRIYDADGAGVAAFDELASGLSVLCGGDRDDKARAVFGLFDLDGCGSISQEDMAVFLASVFKLMFHASPATRARFGVSAEDLAVAATAQAFSEAVLDASGRLSLAAFQDWYGYFGPLGTEQEDEEDGEQYEVEEDELDANFGGAHGSGSEGPHLSARAIQNAASLSKVSVSDLSGSLAESADEDGFLDVASFTQCMMEHFVLPRAARWPRGQILNAQFLFTSLFTVFEPDQYGMVDFTDVASGMSGLCGGSFEDKVRSTFSLFDDLGDGICLEDMQAYLRAVYRLIFALHPESAAGVAATPERLANVTAAQAFEQAGVGVSGKLSLDQFSNWFLAVRPDGGAAAAGSAPAKQATLPPNSATQQSQPPLSVHEIRGLTGLGNLDTAQIFDEFASVANQHGAIGRRAFENTMFRLLRKHSQLHPSAITAFAQQLFLTFAAPGSDTVDFTELSSGLSVLCGGGYDDKVRAAFELFDTNQDGYISKEEMRTYLVSVFKLLYATQPDLKTAVGVPPEELGAATAEQAFIEADTDRDGRVSFDEFKRWYAEGGAGVGLDVVKAEAPRSFTLAQVRELTGLADWDVNDVVRIFLEAAGGDGAIRQTDFNQCVRMFARAAGHGDPRQLSELNAVLSGLFGIFDADGSGRVDVSELVSGLSVLCSGNRDDKVRIAFELFDADGNGFISQQEMYAYLLSVFRVMYETDPATQNRTGVNPEELAKATTMQAFQDADLNGDGKLSFEEFTRWYTSSSGLETPSTNTPPPTAPSGGRNETSAPVARPRTSIQAAQQLLKLHNFTLTDFFDSLVEASPEGFIGREEFLHSMLHLIRLGGGLRIEDEELSRALELAEDIYDAFDPEGGDCVDLAHITSGLSVLCAGNMAEKIDFAFALYDADYDGLVSRGELVTYLTSVFTVLFILAPELKAILDEDMSAGQLAVNTASTAFEEAGLPATSKLGKAHFKSFVHKGLGDL